MTSAFVALFRIARGPLDVPTVALALAQGWGISTVDLDALFA
ncbi:MAG: hypothetical protein AVDCRST_MAG73-1874 [uncultured Thermomicrobiales bacterium]|uniref:Uncharacterized protein n=1 Tax=uncultured Thermomicrobiales bacterium TaxID=1645740 RepID=A0A6J4U5B6_9BACT|nr:MAG: hypothetical protein AVDCRST_MAG73-1874 [uncultured Thermomicrobiales bacterium]